MIKNMPHNFKDLLRKFCLESSFVGLKYFYLYPDWISRCYWAVSMISMFSSAWILIWLLYTRFDEMPTRITIENQYEPLENLPFPSIAICSPNQISVSALKHIDKTLVEGNRSIDFNYVIPKLIGFYEIIGDFDQHSLIHFQSIIEKNRYQAMHVMGMMPQKCEDFLKLCLYKGMNYPNCKGVFYPVLTKRGLCCVFNNIYRFENAKRNEKIHNFTIRKATAKQIGITSALTVVADYNPEDAADGTVVNAGSARVMVMESTEFPSEDESSVVRPNSESFHIIHPTYTYCSADVQALPLASRKCLMAHERTIRYFGEYHSSDCSLLCHIHEIEKHCHCTMLYVPHVHLERSCNFSSIPCINHVKSQLSNWHSDDECDCPRDCESYWYRTEMVIGDLDALQHLTVNPYGDMVFNESSYLMHFFFPRAVYVKKKQETVMSLIIFCSNLGGVFGLCLGCSIISFIELLYFIGVVIRNKIKRKRVHHRRFIH